MNVCNLAKCCRYGRFSKNMAHQLVLSTRRPELAEVNTSDESSSADRHTTKRKARVSLNNQGRPSIAYLAAKGGAR